MAEIKSTLEKVLERAAAMGQASKEELASEEKNKQGMRLAAEYLQGKTTDLSGSLELIEKEVLVRRGLVEVLLRNIILPRDEDQQRTEKAMQGLLELGKNSGDTRSPVATLDTPSPTATTSPAPSDNGTIGSACVGENCPITI